MPVGIVVSNTSGILQIDQDLSHYRKVFSKYCADYWTPGGWRCIGWHLDYYPWFDLTAACGITANDGIPLVLIRPTSLNSYVGGFQVVVGDSYTGTTPGHLYLIGVGEAPFNIEVYSTAGTPISDNSNYGFEVFTQSGAVSYSSRHFHPRLQSFHLKPDYVPVDVFLTGYSDIPWFVANTLPYKYDSGSDYAVEWFFVAKALSFNSVRLEVAEDLVSMGVTRPSKVGANDDDYFIAAMT